LLQGLSDRIAQGQSMKNEAVDALERQRQKTMQAREEARKYQEDLAIAQVCWPTSSSPCCRENELLVRDIDTLDIGC
jgi:hypothetical protein